MINLSSGFIWLVIKHMRIKSHKYISDIHSMILIVKSHETMEVIQNGYL